MLVIEQGPLPNPRATSYGVSRLLRLAYHEGEAYVPLCRRASRGWRDLQRRRGERLLVPTGSLTLGREPGDVHDRARAACEAHDLDHEVWTGPEAAERFPALSLSDAYNAVYQPDGGVLDAEACLVAPLEEAARHGATLRGHIPVEGWTGTSDAVRVKTGHDTYCADRLVITSGAWATSQVDALDDLLRLDRHVACRFLPPDHGAYGPGRLPAFVMDAAEGQFYGCPAGRLPGVKVGRTDDDEPGASPDDHHAPSRAEERPTRTFVDRHLSGAAGTAGRQSCVLSHTPDDDFIVDTLPADPRVVLAVGLSGHGFKFGPVIGELVADLVDEAGGPPKLFRLDRFDV